MFSKYFILIVKNCIFYRIFLHLLSIYISSTFFQLWKLIVSFFRIKFRIWLIKKVHMTIDKIILQNIVSPREEKVKYQRITVFVSKQNFMYEMKFDIQIKFRLPFPFPSSCHWLIIKCKKTEENSIRNCPKFYLSKNCKFNF